MAAPAVLRDRFFSVSIISSQSILGALATCSAERMRSSSWRSQSAGIGLVKSAIISTPLK
jgi:Na+/melibiose symporter-like transporter